MNWKKVWKVTKIVACVGGTVLFVCGVLVAILGGPPAAGGRGSMGSGGGGSIWTVGGGGKKPGSWSSGRHK